MHAKWTRADEGLKNQILTQGHSERQDNELRDEQRRTLVKEPETLWDAPSWNLSYCESTAYGR